MKKILLCLLMLFMLCGCSQINYEDIRVVQYSVVTRTENEKNKSITIYKRGENFYYNAIFTKDGERQTIEGEQFSPKFVRDLKKLFNKKNITFSKAKLIEANGEDLYYMLNVGIEDDLMQTVIEDEEIINTFENIFKTYIGRCDQEENDVDFTQIKLD